MWSKNKHLVPGKNYNPSVCHATCLFGGPGSGSVSCLNKCQFCLVTVYQRLNLVSGPVSHFQHLSVCSKAIPYLNITLDLLNRTYLFNLHIWKHETEGLLRNNRIWRSAKSFRQKTIEAKCVCNIGSQDTAVTASGQGTTQITARKTIHVRITISIFAPSRHFSHWEPGPSHDWGPYPR